MGPRRRSSSREALATQRRVDEVRQVLAEKLRGGGGVAAAGTAMLLNGHVRVPLDLGPHVSESAVDEILRAHGVADGRIEFEAFPHERRKATLLLPRAHVWEPAETAAWLRLVAWAMAMAAVASAVWKLRGNHAPAVTLGGRAVFPEGPWGWEAWGPQQPSSPWWG